MYGRPPLERRDVRPSHLPVLASMSTFPHEIYKHYRWHVTRLAYLLSLPSFITSVVLGSACFVIYFSIPYLLQFDWSTDYQWERDFINSGYFRFCKGGMPSHEKQEYKWWNTTVSYSELNGSGMALHFRLLRSSAGTISFYFFWSQC